MHIRALAFVTATWVLLAGAVPAVEVPEEIHLLLPYPEGKADSVLAVADPHVFIAQEQLDALLKAADTAVPKPSRPPVVGVVSSAAFDGGVSGDAADITVRYVVDLLADTLIYVPLVGQATPVLSVTRGTTPLVVTRGGEDCTAQLMGHGRTGGFWGTLLRGPGRITLETRLRVPVVTTGDRRTLQMAIPPVGASTFTLALPPGDWQAESTDAPRTIRDSREGSILTMHPGRGGQLSAVWWPAVRRVTRAQDQVKVARIEATTEQLITLGEAAVKGIVDVDLRIWAGQAQLLKFGVPPDLEIMQVTGTNVDTWEQKDNEISVYLAGPVQGSEHVTFEYLITLPGPSGVVSVPTFVVGGAHRQNAFWAVVATTNIEVELETHEGVEILQARELPAPLRQRAPGRILLAFRGTPETASAALRVSRHEDVPVLVAAIDRASLSTVLYESGEQVTTCTYRVRNTTKQFLELDLPTNSHLWHVRVDGQPVRPGIVDERVLLPLASSVGRIQEKSFLVELTYMIPGRPPGLVGNMRLDAPLPDLPCSRVQWMVHYPERVRPVRWGGNLEREEPTPSAEKLPVGEFREVLEPQTSMERRKTEPEPSLDSSQAPEPSAGVPLPPVGSDEALREQEEAASSRGRQAIGRSEIMQRTTKQGQQLAEQQAHLPRRWAGKPSVAVEAPPIGRHAAFRQILQQDEAPSISCWYVREGVRWEYGALVALVLLFLILLAGRRRAASFLVLLFLAFSTPRAAEQVVPREVVRLVSEKELSSLFLGPSPKEQAFVPYSKITNLIRTLRTARRFFETPSLAYLDNLVLSLDVQAEKATARGTATLVSFGQGWRQVPFLRDPAQPGRTLLEGEPAPLWTTGQATNLLVDQEGVVPLEIEYLVPVSSQGNRRTVTLPFPPSSGIDFTIRLPAGSSGLQIGGKRVELSEDDGGLMSRLPLTGEQITTLSWRFVPPELVLPSALRPSEDELGPGRLLAESTTLFSVDVGAVVGQTHLSLDIIQGYCDSLTFSLPAKLEVLEVSSISLEDWLIREHDEQRSLLVYVKPKSRGRHGFDLVFEVPLADSLTRVVLSEPALRNTVRFRGQAGVQVLSSLRVTAMDQEKASRTDPRDLPPAIWSRAPNPILLAYKFVESDYRMTLRLEQQEDVPLLSASVDREELLSVVSPTGRAVHRARLEVRNSGEQFLRVSLPEKARIWTYLVDGKTFAPSKSNDGAYRLPVPASRERDGELEPVNVELVWGEDMQLTILGGRLNLAGPGLDIPCSVVDWQLYLPKKRNWFPPRSNLKRDLRLPPSARHATDRKSAEVTLDMLRQLTERDLPSAGAGEGWELGAMPVQVDIPLEGKRLSMGRAMLLGEPPRIELWVTPAFPRIPVVVVSVLLVTLYWRFMREFRVVGFLVRTLVTALLIVVCDPLAILGVPLGLLWRAFRPAKRSGSYHGA